MKKAQAQTQIFIYVIAALVFVSILIYGYNAIRDFGAKSDQISTIKFKTDVTSTVKRVAPDFGTLKRQEFFLGGAFKEVCFVTNHDNPPEVRADNNNPINNLIIQDAVKSGAEENAFLLTDTLEESFNIGIIEVANHFLCIPSVNGKVKIEFEGKGDHAIIRAHSS